MTDILDRLHEEMRAHGRTRLILDAIIAIEQRDAELAQVAEQRDAAMAERDALRAERDRLQNELDNYALEVVSLRAELGRVKAEECLRALAPEEPQR